MIIISNPVDQEKIKKALQEISDAKTNQSAEAGLIKDIVTDLHEQYKDQLTKKQINKMARVFHKRSFQKESSEQEEFETLYVNILGESD